MRKRKNNLGITARVPLLDLKCPNTATQRDYALVLNGKHVKNVSETAVYSPNWRSETLQNKRCIRGIAQR